MESLKILKIKDKNKACIYALSFLLPFLCMGVIYALFKVFPFGDRTALVMDLNGQYADFFAYYHRVLTGNESLLYSFGKEMGGNVFGLFTYYLSSPFFLLALFFPNKIMPEGIALITLLKVGSCGLTFAIFLKNVFKRCDLSVVLFSCCYALMTYSMHYAMCVMWLDAVVWLPLVLLGVERVIDGKSGWVFLIFYVMTVFANYYTAYMSTIFVVIYFFARYFSRDGKPGAKDLLIKTGRMLGLGAVAAMLAAVVLLPSFLNIFEGKMSSAAYVADGFWNIDIFKIFRRLFIGQYDSITNRGNPNIFCGMLCGLMTGVFFFNPKIKIRAKIAALCVYAVLIVSFFIKRIDMAWHIFQYPNWYPYRYAYVFCFFSVMTAFYGFACTDKTSVKRAAAGIGAYLILLIAVKIFKADVLTNKNLAAVSIAFALVYAAGVLVIAMGGERMKKCVCAALILLTCTELVINGLVTTKGLNKEHTYKSRSEYSDYVSEISGFTDFLKNDDGLYRAEKTFSRTDNDSMTFGYNGMTHYSSTYNRKILNFVAKMGLVQTSSISTYKGSTLLSDSLLGFKYIGSETEVNDEYKEVYAGEGFKIYENPGALPLAFAVDEAAVAATADTGWGIENQNALARALLKNSYAEKVGSRRGSGAETEFTAASDGEYFVNFRAEVQGNLNIRVNGINTDYKYDDKSSKKIFYLGKFKAGDNVRFSIGTGAAPSDAAVYRVDSARFVRDCKEKAEKNGLKITEHGNTWLKGNIDMGENSVLFTTIPYERGWTAYVDGKKAEIIEAQNAFAAVRTGGGSHEVKFKYRSPGLGAGMLVSFLTLAGVLIYLFRKAILKNINKFRRGHNGNQ